VAVDSLGSAHCVWLHQAPEWTGASVGYARQGGNYWSESSNTREIATTSGRPRIDRGIAGSVDIVWSTTGLKTVWQEVDHDGLTVIDDQVVSGQGAQASRPRVATFDANVLFSWADKRGGAAWQVYCSDLLGYVAEGNRTTTTGSAFNHALAALGPQAFAVAWQDNYSGQNQIYFRSQTPALNLTMHRAAAAAIANGDATPGTGIDTPLELFPTPAKLRESCAIPLSRGLVADGVTPLLFKFEVSAAVSQAATYRLSVAEPGGGTIPGGLSPHLRILKDGAWVSPGTGESLDIDVSAHLGSTEIFAYLGGIRSDEIQLGAGARELTSRLTVQRKYADGSLGAKVERAFSLAKPPVALIHGYNTDGVWGAAFKDKLTATRPADGFLCQVQYGVTNGQTDVNTYGDLFSLACLLHRELISAMENGELASSPSNTRWACTRYDVVAHSQGGVLTRMLCSTRWPWTTQDGPPRPFRSPEDFHRGRFHRIVTIGSPQNGTSLLYYLLQVREHPPIIPQPASFLPQILTRLLQENFDPWGEQIGLLNRDLAVVDAAAKLHAVGTRIPELPMAFRLLMLGQESIAADFGKPGHQIVLPLGSDGVVDLASQLAGGATHASTFPNVAHAAVGNRLVDLFGTPNGQTEYAPLAAGVRDLLDGSDAPFGAFEVPAPADIAWKNRIDAFVREKQNFGLALTGDILRLIPGFRSPRGGGTIAKYTIDPAAVGEAPGAPPDWYAEVFGPHGISTEGITLTVDEADPSTVTVAVDEGVRGEVVLYCSYLTPTGKVVFATPVSVANHPPGTVMTRISLAPAEIVLNPGQTLAPELWGHFDNGSSVLLHVPVESELEFESSDPDTVAPVAGNLLKALGPGTATISATYAGHPAQSTVIVRDSIPPLLSLPPGRFAKAATAAGAVVEFEVVAYDKVDGPLVAVVVPPSGSVFPPGVTTVAVTATDAAGNTTSGFFKVLVGDPAHLLTQVVVRPPQATVAASVAGEIRGGPPGGTVTIQASSDLGVSDSWRDIGAVVLDDSGNAFFGPFEDPTSIGLAHDFFRAKLP
jgi:hypothetical protein